MLAKLMAALLGKAGFGFLDRVLTHIENKADSEAERARIEAGRQAGMRAEAAGVVKTGMEHKLFWIPWLIAAVPTTLWYGWGIMDSTLWNGAILPDVAELPPQLKAYADVVMGNIFYAGAGMAGLQVIARAMRR